MNRKVMIFALFLGFNFFISSAYGNLTPATPSLISDYNRFVSNKKSISKLDDKIESLREIAYDSEASEDSKRDLAAFLMLKVYHQIDKSYDENEALLSEASELVPDNDYIEQLWGYACYYNGDYESGINHFETSLSLNPDNDTIYKRCGECYYHSQNFEKALEYFEKVLQNNPDSDRCLYYAGDCEYELNNYKESIAYYEKALEQNLEENLKESIEKKLIKAKDRVTSTENSTQENDSHFIMNFEGNSKEVWGDMPSETLNDVYDEVTKLLDCYPENKINVIFYLTENYYKDQDTPNWAGGNAENLTIEVPLKIADNKEFARGALAHEFTHALINLKTHNNAPLWVHEGLAQYIEFKTRYGSEKILRDDYISLYENEFLKNNFFLPLDNVPQYMKSKDMNDVHKAYIVSWLAIRYMLEKQGESTVSFLLDSLCRGKDIKKAVSDVTGGTYKEFENDLKKWIKSQKENIPNE
jgi:tetratricopeptide (TPR) repeat protein